MLKSIASPRLARRLDALVLLLLLLLTGCTPISLEVWTPTPVEPTAEPTLVPTLPAVPTPAPAATATALPTPEPTPTPESTATPPPADLYLAEGDVTTFPSPQLYSGDQVTLDIVPRNLGMISPNSVLVRVYRQGEEGKEVIGESWLGYPTFDSVPRARLVWAWDTEGLSGEQTLVVWVDPEDQVQAGDADPSNNVVTLTVPVLPREEMPEREAVAAWETSTIDCCHLHYLNGSSAERDLAAIIQTAEEAVDEVESKLGVTMTERLDVYFADKVIGQGGYAYEGIVLSYLDRHYSGVNLPIVFRHESTHVVDNLLFGVYPPSMLREGLATWMGGGHFKIEPIPERTAALLELDWYVGLEELANNFYQQQHEVGYLEGAGFIAFLVDRYGWDAFLSFYSSFQEAESPSAMLEATLQSNLGMDLATAERAFKEWLAEHPPTPAQVRDLKDTVEFFDTVRRYQALEDPSAYWMSGLLPHPGDAERRGIVADFTRNPRAVENIALETMLIAAREAIFEERFAWGEELMAVVNRVLEEGTFIDPLAADYLAVAHTVMESGYEAQQIEIEGDRALVWAIADWPTLVELTVRQEVSGWALE